MLEYIATTFIIFLEFSIHCKTNKINQEFKIKFLFTKIFTKLYQDFMNYIIFLKLNVHSKFEMSFKTGFLIFQ